MSVGDQRDVTGAEGARASFEEFVSASSTRLFTMALLLTGRQRADAEDLLQGVLERAYRHWRRICRNGDPEPYVRQMLVHASVDRWRQRRRQREQSLAAVAANPPAGDQTSEIADRDLLLRALSALPAGQRAVLVLRYFCDLSEAQTAATLDCSVGSVKKQTARALASMRASLGRRPSPNPAPGRQEGMVPCLMSDLERRLRAAMIAASEQPPANLMQEIRRRHRRHVRRVSCASVAVAAAIAITVPPVAHALRAGHPAGARPVGPASVGPVPGFSTPSAAPADGCQPAVGALAPDWRDSSFRVGPVWFAYDRTQGYVHLGSSPGDHRGAGQLEVGVMIVEVDYGSRAALTVDPGARSYFRLLNGFDNGSGPYPLSAGFSSLTLVSCPPETPPGDNGRVSDYYLGFIIKEGSDALVDVRTSASARPVQVTFTCLRTGCDT